MTADSADSAATNIWATPGWRRDAEDWIHAVLAQQSRRLVGPIEQPRIRPWSTQLTVPTDAGRWWFKENTAALRHEVLVVQALGRIAPERVVPTIAVDGERGRLLTPDQGPTLRDAGAQSEAVWHRIVSDVALLQRAAVDHGPELATAGLPHLSPADIPDWVISFVDELAMLPNDDLRSMAPPLASAVIDFAERSRPATELLSGGPVPLSLEQNDLHPNNAFVPSGSEPLRLFDFGDALWGHPFAVMMGTRRPVIEAPDDPFRTLGPEVMARVEQTYLDVWSDLAPVAELRSLLDVATAMAPIHRALVWRQMFRSVPIDQLRDYARLPVRWLSEWAGITKP